VTSAFARRLVPWLTALCLAPGCAGTLVKPSDIPPAPEARARRAGTVVLLLKGVPAPMADELRSFARGLGPTEEKQLASGNLREACGSPEDLVLRPRLTGTHFASNAPDRNTLFIYETAVVVGIPVTLVSLVAWPYYGETIVEGELDHLDCAADEPTRQVAFFHLRSEGRGIVRTQTLRDAQYDAAVSGLTRRLLAADFAELNHGRNEP
jgi:hypothetical protein